MSPARIPVPENPKFYRREWFASFMSGVGGCLGASLGSAAAWVANSAPWVRFGSTGVAVLAVVNLLYAIYRGREKDKKTIQERSPKDLEGCLHVLFELVCYAKGIKRTDPPSKRFRVTIHSVVSDEKYMQCVPYMSTDGDKGQLNREFPTRAGIVGRLIRDGGGDPLMFIRQVNDLDQLRRQLVAEWGYKREEVRNEGGQRWCHFAVPVRDGHHTVGVLYADSAEQDFFSEDVQELLVNGAVGLASFIRERYAGT